MNSIEKAYIREMNRLTPQERVAKSISMYCEVRQMIENKIRREEKSLTEHQIQIRVARKFYLSDPYTQRLLDKME